jgi:hypothetical protein
LLPVLSPATGRPTRVHWQVEGPGREPLTSRAEPQREVDFPTHPLVAEAVTGVSLFVCDFDRRGSWPSLHLADGNRAWWVDDVSRRHRIQMWPWTPCDSLDIRQSSIRATDHCSVAKYLAVGLHHPDGRVAYPPRQRKCGEADSCRRRRGTFGLGCRRADSRGQSVPTSAWFSRHRRSDLRLHSVNTTVDIRERTVPGCS